MCFAKQGLCVPYLGSRTICKWSRRLVQMAIRLLACYKRTNTEWPVSERYHGNGLLGCLYTVNRISSYGCRVCLLPNRWTGSGTGWCSGTSCFVPYQAVINPCSHKTGIWVLCISNKPFHKFCWNLFWETFADLYSIICIFGLSKPDALIKCIFSSLVCYEYT
jgi:hypothetical protein